MLRYTSSSEFLNDQKWVIAILHICTEFFLSIIFPTTGLPLLFFFFWNLIGNVFFQLIFSGEYTKAMNKDWHSGHFCCWQCDESLTGQRYVLRDEHPYCIKCYESVFANGCEECNKIIGIDSKVRNYYNYLISVRTDILKVVPVICIFLL